MQLNVFTELVSYCKQNLNGVTDLTYDTQKFKLSLLNHCAVKLASLEASLMLVVQND